MSIPTALYYRASSPRQSRRGSSIPDQRARLVAEALAHGETVVAEYVDQARTATSVARRADYQRMLADARASVFKRLRIESVDRGHRNDLERRQFEVELQKLGIEIVYSGEPDQQPPEYRKFNRGIRGVVAELESDQTSQRTYKRMRYRAEKGKWRGGSWPYGLRPDGEGWFERDLESYATLIWVLEQRAEGVGYHTIAKQLNQGIVLDGGPRMVPPTPGLLAWQRRPYLERQDPATGELTQIPRPQPSGTWLKQTIRHLCIEAVDGIYAGVLNWGRTVNRFDVDGDGNAKHALRVETGKVPLPGELLRRVAAVELAASTGASSWTTAGRRTFLLRLRCGACGQAMHGYTSTKPKGGKVYKYRKYRCAGRANTAGSCRTPIMSADAIEERVLDAVFADVASYGSEAFRAALNSEIERQRSELQSALDLLAGELADLIDRREAALDSLTQHQLAPRVRAAISERVDSTIADIAEIEVQQRTLRAGLQALGDQARTLVTQLSSPLLVPARWQEPEVYQALRRALQLLVHHATLLKIGPGQYVVQVWMYDLTELVKFVKSGVARARGSRTHRRGSSPRPTVLKTATSTGQHPLS